MTIKAPAGSSAELVSIVRQANQELGAITDPKIPTRVEEYANAAALPSAANWRAAIVFVKSIDRLAVSNGTNWLRVDTGASL